MANLKRTSPNDIHIYAYKGELSEKSVFVLKYLREVKSKVCILT